MPARVFPTLERTDLIIQSYDASLPRALMDTDATPRPGASVEFDTGTTVTFQGSFVRRGEPGPDAHLFAVELDAPGGGDAIERWLTETLQDDLFASVETAHGVINLEIDDLETALEGPSVASEM